MAIPPRPPEETKRPNYKRIDVKDMVERLDPKRHEPEDAYVMTNGRRFKRPA